MKNLHIRKLTVLSVLALGAPLFASAQAVQNSPAPATDPVVTDTGPGLVGTNYAELSYGYQSQKNAPTALHDYEFVSNESVYRQGILGADANFVYNHEDGDGAGFRDRLDTLEFGGTGYLTQVWGKPFVTGDFGWGWERAADVSRKGFVYNLDAGVEFAVLRDLAVSPFIGYDAMPHFYNHERPYADFPDHTVDYGVKATYRFTRQWSASATATLDQYSSRDWGLKAGVSYHF
jgi:hypothetical protein